MKWYKKALALALALALVITGIYIGETQEGSRNVKAADTQTEVNEDMLDVKVQVATNGSAVMRFVSSVDNLNYKNVGFEVTPKGGKTVTYVTYTVFERINSEENYVTYTFSPKVVDVESEYFVTAKMNVEAGTEYTVQAYVTTLEGDVVYGQSRCVTLADGTATETVNMSFENTLTTEVDTTQELTVTYDDDNNSETADKSTTAEIISVKDKTVHVRVAANVNSLKSATKFTFSGTAAGSTIYRNLFTTHATSTGAANADTTWYDVYKAADSTEKKFVIATTADLYGFASLVDGGNQFSGLTAYLCSDLTVNTNTPEDANLEASWANYTAQYDWEPIGGSGRHFKGVFSGENHSISGLFVDRTGDTSNDYKFVGLFGCTEDSTVENLRILDSCFRAYQYVGGVSGYGGGTFDTVYTNAVVSAGGTVSTSEKGGGYCGGIIGAVDKGGTITNCQFDGNVKGKQYCGGVTAGVNAKTLTINNVLVSGDVESVITGNYGNIGGICGYLNGTTSVIKATDCVITGTVTSPTGGSGELVGHMYQSTFEYSDIYIKKGCFDDATSVGAKREIASVTSTAPTRLEAEKLSGQNAYINTELDFWINNADENEDNVWVARTGKDPILKSFEDENSWLVITSYIKADTEWYTDATADADGNTAGTEANPYVIKDADDLLGLATLVNNGTSNFEGLYIVLDKDVTFNTNIPENADRVASWENYTAQFEWTPIGTNWSGETGPKHFHGKFNGQGHTISGLYTSEVADNGRWAGLFGITGDTAVIQNLTLVNSYFASCQQVGSISSRGGGTFKNIVSNAVVVSSAFTGTATTVYIGNTAGGILGQLNGNEATITNCHYSGEIQTDATSAGGIVAIVGGGSSLDVTDCSFSGKVTAGDMYAGGIAANISSKAEVNITRSIVSGDVIGDYRCGGIVGYVKGKNSSELATVNITDCQFSGTAQTTTTSAPQSLGGICGMIQGYADVTATRYLQTGTLEIAQKTKNWANALVGMVTGDDSTLDCLNVYFVGSNVEIPEFAYIGIYNPDIVNEEDGTTTKTFTNVGWKSDESHVTIRNVGDGTTIVGANAVTNASGLNISTDPTSTSTWVATKTGFPTLRIFADEADIYTVTE